MNEVFDLHADIGYDVMQKRRQNESDILNRYHVEKLKKGNISFICMASNFEGHESWADMQEMILALKEEIAMCEMVDLILTKDDLLCDNGHIKAVLSIEGMCGIRDDVEHKIEWLYQQGVKIASLCWNDENALASGVGGNPEHGLSELGKQAIQKMKACHMAVDVSHANEKTFWDIMDIKDVKVMATHSNARTLCDHKRNLWDEQIDAIHERHGIIGIVSAPGFVSRDKEKQDIAHMVQHIRYMCERIGKENVAFGLDYMDFYEGYDDVHVKELNDASYTQNLITTMRACGMSEQEIAMISCGNAIRFLFDLL